MGRPPHPRVRRTARTREAAARLTTPAGAQGCLNALKAPLSTSQRQCATHTQDPGHARPQRASRPRQCATYTQDPGNTWPLGDSRIRLVLRVASKLSRQP
ncbi:hypothetical protein Apa02nite_069260 [Actinoplanes palleronii]|uniref:Uncharacterized protein n=1 Tax=Actinoplanes palleronii TaxID=113570 RepID=A0ABQ4BJH0_9ACTN|nr:hypothetical protein Apa02nite_069260 [Actinoplanes palleronii]